MTSKKGENTVQLQPKGNCAGNKKEKQAGAELCQAQDKLS